jgi:hypothetical protein
MDAIDYWINSPLVQLDPEWDANHGSSRLGKLYVFS